MIYDVQNIKIIFLIQNFFFFFLNVISFSILYDPAHSLSSTTQQLLQELVIISMSNE